MNMNYLAAMELIDYALDIIKVGKRAQIPKTKLQELKNTLLQVHGKLGEEANMSTAIITLSDTLGAIAAIESTDIIMLTNEMRTTLAQGVTTIKQQVADVCFDYYSKNEFEITAEIIPLMREVVRVAYGGVR